MYGFHSTLRLFGRTLPALMLLVIFASPAMTGAMEHKDGGDGSSEKKLEEKSQPTTQPTTQPSEKTKSRSGKDCPCKYKKQGHDHDEKKYKCDKCEKRKYDDTHHMLKMMAHMKKRDDDRKKKHHDLDDMLGQAPKSLKKKDAHGKKGGVPHLYHIAAEDFLLDKKDKLGLSDEQKDSLKKIVENVHLTLATHHRKIEQAEQELWVLTGKDAPAASSVEARMNEIAELKVAKRMAFFNAVGEAVDVLTDEQRTKLLE